MESHEIYTRAETFWKFILFAVCTINWAILWHDWANKIGWKKKKKVLKSLGGRIDWRWWEIEEMERNDNGHLCIICTIYTLPWRNIWFSASDSIWVVRRRVLRIEGFVENEIQLFDAIDYISFRTLAYVSVHWCQNSILNIPCSTHIYILTKHASCVCVISYNKFIISLKWIPNAGVVFQRRSAAAKALKHPLLW